MKLIHFDIFISKYLMSYSVNFVADKAIAKVKRNRYSQYS